MPHHSTIKPHTSTNLAGAFGVYRRLPAPLRASTMEQPINASRPITNNQSARRVSSPGSMKTTHLVLKIHSLSRLAAERIREILLATTRDRNVLLGKSSCLSSTSSRVSDSFAFLARYGTDPGDSPCHDPRQECPARQELASHTYLIPSIRALSAPNQTILRPPVLPRH